MNRLDRINYLLWRRVVDDKLKYIGIGVLVIVGLYFLISPYQVCKRELNMGVGMSNVRACTQLTSW